MGGYRSGRRGPRSGAAALADAAPRLDVDGFARVGRPLAGPDRDAVASLTTLAGRLVYALAARPVGCLEAGDDGPPGAAAALEVGPMGDDGAPVCPAVVALDWRRVGYGWRPFVVCPDCGGRCRLLYAPAWRCRRCARLAYRSTRLDDCARLSYRARRAADALGTGDAWTCSNAALAGAPDVLRRPAGMHRRAYLRRLAAWRRARSAFALALALELGRGWPSYLAGAALSSSGRSRAADVRRARAAAGCRVARW